MLQWTTEVRWTVGTAAVAPALVLERMRGVALPGCIRLRFAPNQRWMLEFAVGEVSAVAWQDVGRGASLFVCSRSSPNHCFVGGFFSSCVSAARVAVWWLAFGVVTEAGCWPALCLLT
ncbi:hypothetical protein Ancab_031988, partial [Ancistrocladus abbreviatus]